MLTEIGHCRPPRLVADWKHKVGPVNVTHTHCWCCQIGFWFVLSWDVTGVLRGRCPAMWLCCHTRNIQVIFWKAEGEMCKANHAAERSYAQCEITEQHSLYRRKFRSLQLRRCFIIIVIMITHAGRLVQSRTINPVESALSFRWFISFSFLVFSDTVLNPREGNRSLVGKIKLLYHYYSYNMFTNQKKTYYFSFH